MSNSNLYPDELFKLIQLSEVPEKLWIGLPVFHPMGQMDDPDKPGEILCQWETDEYDPPVGEPAYDVGIVTDFGPDPYFSDVKRVRFIGSFGSVLYYSSDNLWTPETSLLRGIMSLLSYSENKS